MTLSRHYEAFDFEAPYRPDPNLWFECLKCGGVVRSLPKRAWHCDCGNVSIDVAACRFDVGDRSNVRAFRRRDDVSPA